MEDATPVDTKPTDPHAECAQRLSECEAKWKRAVADAQNREKDFIREREEFTKWCTADVVRDFFSIADAVEAANRPHPPAPPLPEGRGEIEKKFSPSHREGEREGVGAIAQLCQDFLRRHGVEPVGAVGDRVDYLLHEVVGTKQVPHDFSPSHREGEREGVGQEKNIPGVILEVAQVGYTMHGRLLRPAKVIIQEEMTNDETRINESPPESDPPLAEMTNE